jgi:mRNA interferase RelE/StbE
LRYTLVIRPKVEKSMASIPAHHREKIEETLALLGEEPRLHGAIKMKGEDAYRYRVGDYRIVYEIHDDKVVVLVVAVKHRKDIYR